MLISLKPFATLSKHVGTERKITSGEFNLTTMKKSASELDYKFFLCGFYEGFHVIA